MKAWVAKTRRPEVIGGLGGFAGLFDACALDRYRQPLLATSTDGVGTKVAIAQAMDIHDTIGFDLVGMVVDDLVVCGAEPLFMTDYIACGRVVPERIAAIVKGIAEACVVAGCALRRRRDRRAPRPAGAGRVRRGGRRDRRGRGRRPARPGPGARRRRAGRDGLERPALQRLLAGAARAARAGRLGARPRTSPSSAAPSARSCSSRPASTPRRAWRWPDETDVHAMAHVTGGGLAANLARVLPGGLSVSVDRGTWTPAPVFGVVRRVGRGVAGGPRGDPELRRRAWSPCCRPTTSTAPSPPSSGSASPPGRPARSRSTTSTAERSRWSGRTPPEPAETGRESRNRLNSGWGVREQPPIG